MKNSVKGIVVIAMLLIASVAQAQRDMQKKTPEERAQTQVQWMQKNLSLTGDQNKKAYDIILRYAQKADEMRNSSAGGGNRRQEMQAMQQDKDNELKGVLTGDQYQKYQAHVQEMKEKMQERRGSMQQGGN